MDSVSLGNGLRKGRGIRHDIRQTECTLATLAVHKASYLHRQRRRYLSRTASPQSCEQVTMRQQVASHDRHVMWGGSAAPYDCVAPAS